MGTMFLFGPLSHFTKIPDVRTFDYLVDKVTDRIIVTTTECINFILCHPDNHAIDLDSEYIDIEFGRDTPPVDNLREWEGVSRFD